jgi:hypothetical protein
MFSIISIELPTDNTKTMLIVTALLTTVTGAAPLASDCLVQHIGSKLEARLV